MTDLDLFLLDQKNEKQPDEDPDVMTVDDILKGGNASYKSLFIRKVIPYSGGH